jgi:hypothetical protein
MTDAHNTHANGTDAGSGEDASIVFVVGLPSLVVSLLGVLGSQVSFLLGPILGIAAIILFLRRRPTRQPVAAVGLVFGVLAIVVPAYIALAWTCD